MSNTRSAWMWKSVEARIRTCSILGGWRLKRTRGLFVAAGLLASALAGRAAAQNQFLIPPAPLDPAAAVMLKASAQFEQNAQPNPPQDGPTKGDPVSLLTGELQVNETDLSLVGRGIDFTLSRSYRSRTLRSSAMGSRWDFNWNQFVVLEYGLLQPPGDQPGGDSAGIDPIVIVGAYYYDGDNRIVPFFPDLSATEWATPPGYFAKLRHDGVPPIYQNPPTRFQIRNADGTILTFGLRDNWDPYVSGLAAIYRLTRLEDRSGNVLDFQYELIGSGVYQYHRLLKVLDTLSTATNVRAITFNYAGAYAGAILTSVQDFAGRTVVYDHDSAGNLTEVRSPTVVGTVTLNDYPAGKRTKYIYPPFSAGSTHNQDLLQVINPQEFQNGAISNPVPFLQNTYDSGSHVISQMVGGMNASGIAAGGVHTFRYEGSLVPIVHSWFSESLRTLSIDPNGNVQLSLFDEAGNERLSYAFTGRIDPAQLSPSLPIAQIANFTPSTPSTSHSLASGAGASPPLRTSDPGCYFTQRSFNLHGLMTAEWGSGTTAWGIAPQTNCIYSSSTDVFQQGNLLKIERVGQGEPTITTLNAFEPVYNQLRATVDPRGTDGSYIPPNGGSTSHARYISLNIFDYQEDYLYQNGITPLAGLWGIDLVQADQATLMPGLPSITAASNLGDLNGDGRLKSAGNKIILQPPAAIGLSDPLNSGTQFTPPVIAQVSIQYNTYSLPTAITDPESNTTTFTYFPVTDPMGLGASPSSSAGGGMLRLVQQPEGVTSEKGYDLLGRCIKQVNGRGFISEGSHRFATQIIFNELDEVVRVTDALGYETSYLYDWNGDRIEMRRTNRQPEISSQGLPTGNVIDGDSGPLITDYWTFDILRHQLTQDAQVSGTARQVTRYRYDRNGNHVLTLSPEWANDSKNVECVVFDEQDLSWKVTKGSLSAEFRALAANADIPENTTSAIPNNSDAATSTKDYTICGQPFHVFDAENHQTTFVYDSFQRCTSVVDPLGNYNTRTYDPASQTTEVKSHQVGGALLSRGITSFDERGREFENNQALFATNSQVPVHEGPLTPGDGWVTSRSTFNRNDCRVQLVTDNRSSQTLSYDGLSRLRLQSDTTGNTKTIAYDKSSNTIRVAVVEVPSAGGTPDTTVTNYFFDALERQTAVVDNQGLTSRSLYDSRGAVVFSSDPLNTGAQLSFASLDIYGEHPLGGPSVNDHGNTAVHQSDDLGRNTKSTSHLRVGGVGGGALTTEAGDGRITIEQGYDLNNRLRWQKDDNSNVTNYDYNSLDRQAHTAYADGTSEDRTYNPTGTLHTLRDANLSLVTFAYTSALQVSSKTITRGPGVSGTTSESYSYDGLNRILSGSDNDVAVVRRYDSLSRVIEESINGVTTKAVYDVADHLYDLTYPNGRTVHYRYDSIDRLDRVYEEGSSTDIATYKYMGRSRVASRDYPINGRRLTVGYDQSRRVSSTFHNVISSGAGVDRRTFVWNRASSKTSRTDNLTNVVHQFTYDSAYRMITAVRSGSGANQTASFTIDGAEDWSTVVGGQLAGIYTMTGLDQPVNQYTATPGVTRTHDDNGNLTGATGSRNALIVYDYRNQMVSYTDTGTSAQHTYAYDVFGRRASKTINVTTNPSTTRYYYCGARIVEERSGTGSTLVTYIYGNGLDEILSAKRGSNSTFFHQDDLGNVMKVTRSTGSVLTSYEYGEYGQVLNASTFQPLTTLTQSDNLVLFTGAHYDPETGFYHLRSRYLDPKTGRFTSRDPIGIWDDQLNRGNGTTYVGNNPWSLVDPSGCCGVPGPPKTIDMTYGWVPKHIKNLQYYDRRGLMQKAMAPISSPTPPANRNRADDRSILEWLRMPGSGYHGGGPPKIDLESLRMPVITNPFDSTEKVGPVGEAAMELGAAAHPVTALVQSIDEGVTAYKAHDWGGVGLALLGAIPGERLLVKGGGLIKKLAKAAMTRKTATKAMSAARDVKGLDKTLKRIERGEAFPHKNDGSVFQNREKVLPEKPDGYYKEYVHPTEGVNGPGGQRVVVGAGGEKYYTPDHYASFQTIE